MIGDGQRGIASGLIVPMAAMLVCCSLCGAAALAQQPSHHEQPRAHQQRPPSNATGYDWPDWDDVRRVVLLKDYNTRVVLLGSTLLGIGAGVVGTFMLLRRRALVGDVVSHASLPGIAVAFIVLEVLWPGHGKSLPGLLTGAVVAGLLAIVCTTLIRRLTRVKEDASLAIVLSVFFGFGIALLPVIQNIPTGNAAGLNQFIYGKAASMTAADVRLIAAVSALVLICALLLFKELALLCFNEQYAQSQGWPVVRLDLALMAMVVAVSVVGLQSVGLLLVVAMLIIPAAAARFWTDNLLTMVLASAICGGLSAMLGVMVSALAPRLAGGPVIVLVGAMLFAASLLIGTRRGLLWRVLTRWRLRQRVGRHDLLRALYECVEPAILATGDNLATAMTTHPIASSELLAHRRWSSRQLDRLLASAVRESLIARCADGQIRLTSDGARQALRVARNHRLWELFLIHYADIAASHVDRDADQIEHVLEPELIAELEALMQQQYPSAVVPPSPHEIEIAAD